MVTAKPLVDQLDEDITPDNMALKLQQIADLLRDPKVRLYSHQVHRVADIIETIAYIVHQ